MASHAKGAAAIEASVCLSDATMASSDGAPAKSDARRAVPRGMARGKALSTRFVRRWDADYYFSVHGNGHSPGTGGPFQYVPGRSLCTQPV